MSTQAQSCLAKIPLKKGSQEKFQTFLQYLKNNPDDYIYEAKQKGYAWTSMFYECGDECDFVWVVSQSLDWSSIKSDEDIQQGAFRSVYNQFKKDCWLLEKLTEQDFQSSVYDLDVSFLRINTDEE
ncbi:MAG: hypothetical protein R3A11_05935 [Bdellovibrionota bacterium]